MSGNGINCGWVTENLLAGNRGELSGADSRSLDDHLTACTDCRREREEMLLLQQAIDSIPMLTPAADGFSNLMERIGKEQPAAGPTRRGVLLFLGGSLVAVAAVLLMFLLPAPPTPPSPLTPVAGSISVDGTRLTGGGAAGVEFTPAAGTRIATESLALLAFAAPRAGELTLAAGTTLTCLSAGRYRLEGGHLLARIEPGDGAFAFETRFGIVEVTGTTFDLDLTADRLIVAVVDGAVNLRTGGPSPVRVDSGTRATVTAGGIAGAPRPIDPDAITRWCSSPTARLAPRPDVLLLTLANETVRPLVLMSYDPSVGVYALRVEGRNGPEDLKLLESMLVRPAGEPHVLTLEPGEVWEIAIDPAKLGLSPGRYRISAVYNPYTTDLPGNAWRGVLVSPTVDIEVR